MTKPSFKNYFEPTPKNIQKLMFGIKAIIGTAGTAEFFSGNPNAAFYLMLAGAIINEIGNFFGE
jgi:ABC-type cobalt transport system substrate-binding protein